MSVLLRCALLAVLLVAIYVSFKGATTGTLTRAEALFLGPVYFVAGVAQLWVTLREAWTADPDETPPIDE